MHNEEYSQMSSMIRSISGKTVKDIQEDGHTDVASMQQKVLVGMKAMMTLQQELSKLPDGGSLPTWWTNKIAIAVDKLDGLSDYLDTKVESVNESTAAYKKSLEQIAKDRQLKNLTKKDRDTLVKIAKLLDQEKKEDLDETDTVAGDIALKDMPLGKKKDDEEEVNEAKVGDTVSFKWPSSISMNVPQKNRKPGGFVKGILTKVDRTRAKVKIGNKVYSVSTSDLIKEAVEPGPIDPRTLAGKIITGEVKLLTVKQGSPGRRGTSIMATGKPSVMGAPPESIYIDATGNRPRGSGLAIGFGLDQVKSAEIKRDGSARVELK